MTHRPSSVMNEGRGPKGSKGEPMKSTDNDGRNYKLIIDPALGQGKEKILRYSDCPPGGDMPSVKLVDPRPRISRFGINRRNVNLRVPDFKVDKYYVGTILPKEVTMTNLNNNINQSFLQDMCKVFGDIRTATILYHPKTKKHLGIAKVLFSSSSAAQKCIEKLNQTSKMGNIINVFADPSGEKRKKLFDELTAEKAAFRPPSPKEKLPANILEETKSAPSKPFVSTQCNGLGFPDKTASLHSGNFPGPKPPSFPPPAPLPHAFSELNLRVPGHHDSELHFTAMQQENLDSIHRRNFEISANCGGGKDSISSSLGSSSEFVHGRTSQFDRFSNNSAEKSEASSCWRGRSSHSQRNSFDTRKSCDVYSRSKSQDGPDFRRLQGANENSGKSRFSGNSFNAPQSQVQQGGFETKKSSNDLSSGYNRSLSVGQFASHRHFEKQADFTDEICLVPPNSIDVTLIPMTNNSGFASNVQDSFQINHCARNSVDSFEGLDSRLSIESLNSASDLGTPFLDQSSVGLPHGKDDLQSNVQSLLDSDVPTGSKPNESSNLGNFFARANSPREKQHDRLDRRKSENLDFKASISHNHRHGVHHYGSGRHRDHNRESSRRRNRRRKHRSKYHSSKSVGLEKSSQEDQLVMATANFEGIAVEAAEGFGSSSDVRPEDPDADAELRASLESRIQALLDQSEEIAARNLRNGVRFPPPPLPPELPPPPPPLPPIEAELPPLPPEPEPMDGNGWLSMSRMHDGAEMGSLVFCNFGEATLDSLTSQQTARLRTSVRDDIHPLENFPHNSHFVPEVPHPSYHSYFDYNHQSVPREISQNQNLHAAYGNLLASERCFWQQPPPSMAVLRRDSQLRDPSAFRLVEEKFLTVLKEVTFQLRNVIVRDMQKKMVENIGFTVYEDWWKKEEYTEKVVETKPLSSSVLQKVPASVVPTSSDVLAVTSSAGSTASAKPCDASAVLSSLFDNKEGSQSSCFGAIGGRAGFGGGLLGLRGVIAKMPSFRRKHPSPLPDKDHEDAEIEKSGNEEDEDGEEEEVDGEEEETTFRGPRTPEQSDNEEEESSSSSSSSLGDENNLASVGVLRKMQLSRAAVVYSSSSDDSSLSEDEEEREEKMEEEVEASESSDDNEEEEEELKIQEDHSNDDQESQVADGDKEAVIENEAIELKMSRSSECKNFSEGKVNKIEIHALNFAENEINEKGSSPLISPPYHDSSAADADVSSQVAATDFTCSEKTAEDAKSHTEAGAKISATPLHEPVTAVKEVRDVSLKNSLASLPEVGSGKLVVEWLIALSLDHPYCQSLTVDSVNRRGRHSRVRFSLPDTTADSELSDDTVSLTDSAIGLVMTLPSDIVIDHNYCQPYFPVSNPVFESDSDSRSIASLERVAMLNDAGEVLTVEDIPDISMEVEISEQQSCDRKRKRLSDVTNLPGSRELANILPPVVAKPEYVARSEKAESDVRDEFLSKGLDLEDIAYLKKQYEDLVQEDYPRTWVNETHWVNHPPTSEPSPPPRKKMRSSKHGDSVDHHYHVTGSARTEGYYKISSHVKSLYLRHTRAVNDELDSEQKREIASDIIKKKSQQSRDVRSESRRWQNLFATDLGDEIGDILKFNKLEIRKKQLKFARSRIHDWGLFAMEPIAEGEMVIEYVGQVVRRSVADILERRYEAVGIGSSYLFRVDHDVIIDATKHGNLSRFINHSCTPNCYAKIITVDAEKKIVIYSKSDIQVNEEITYDYKFPLEDEKIPCLCGTSGCRGTLN